VIQANTFILLLFSLGAFQGILLSALLRLRYKRSQADYLALISLLFAALIAFYVAFWAKVDTPKYLWWVQYVTFVIAPLFYFLIKGIPFPKALRWPSVLHFFPFAGIAVAMYLPVNQTILFVLQPLHLVAYSAISFRSARSKKAIVWSWVFAPLAAYALLFVLYAMMVATNTLTLEFDYLIAGCSCLFIYSLLIKSYLQPQFINQLSSDEKVSSYVSETVLSQVEEHFKTSKAYLNGEYRIGDLSKELSIKSYQLSEIINQKYDGFSTLLNEYRLRESIDLLNNTDEKIINVAHLSGFNNKVSFYKTFKKATGKTPAEWRRHREKKVNIYTD
jgi:AraC-like DNA-binding protein